MVVHHFIHKQILSSWMFGLVDMIDLYYHNILPVIAFHTRTSMWSQLLLMQQKVAAQCAEFCFEHSPFHSNYSSPITAMFYDQLFAKLLMNNNYKPFTLKVTVMVNTSNNSCNSRTNSLVIWFIIIMISFACFSYGT